ncbi:hypothetical protein [Sphingomonas adhaesiva]|uniref:hypothetical protein n=1 Tax=Sphingomonas adhaesiva TaxID=28212 RepID=UPI002FFBD3E1
MGADGLLDLKLLRSVASEFGVDASKYAHLNPGQQRMNVGNRLRRLVPPTIYAQGASYVPATRVAPPPSRPTGALAASDWPFLATASTTDLLRLQAAAIEELRRRDIVRTANAPLGDYGERLFAQAFDWVLTQNSSATHDAVDSAGRRYQIKARRLRIGGAGERQLGILRALEGGAFDYLAAVLLNRDFSVARAALIPMRVVLIKATYVKHVNGWRFILDDATWAVEGVRDVTNDLREAETRLDTIRSPSSG